MAIAATPLSMSASAFLRATPFTSPKQSAAKPACASSITTTFTTTVVVCHHHHNAEQHTTDISRRLFAVAAASIATTALGVLAQPRAAHAKRNKPAPAEEKPKAELEDKSLSAYDARLLANARRKEAMKASVDKLKAKTTCNCSNWFLFCM